MHKLSKQDIETKDKLLEKVALTHNVLNSNIDSYNKKVKALYEELIAPAVNDANQSINELNDWTSECHRKIDRYHSSRSSAWKKSEEGRRYYNWLSSWDCGEVYEIDIEDVPDELEPIDPETDVVYNLSNSPK